MLKQFFPLLILGAFLQPIKSHGQPSAIELDREEIQQAATFLREISRKTSPVAKFSLKDSYTSSSVKAKIWENKDTQHLVIAFSGIKPLLGDKSTTDAAAYNLSGVIDKKACALENEVFDKFQHNFQDFSGIQCTLAGAGWGGAIALLMGARLANEENLNTHQFKVINFSAPRIGDQEFAKSLYEKKIALEDILHFTRHLDFDWDLNHVKKYVGLPIELTAIEGAIDTFLDPYKLAKRTIQGGILGVGIWAFLSPEVHLTKTGMACATKLGNTCLSQETIVSISKIFSTYIIAKINPVHVAYFNSFLGTPFLEEFALIAGSMGSLFLLRNVDMPSDDLIMRSFNYTKARYNVGSEENSGKIWPWGSRA